MADRFTVRRRVEFRDTDAAGIAHFSMFFVWMEQAEHHALRHLGISVMDPRVEYSWPRVSARCDYKAPVRFEDELEIRLSISRLGSKSVTYEANFYCDNRHVADGQITTVCCRMGQEAGLIPMVIPADVVQKLEQLRSSTELAD